MALNRICEGKVLNYTNATGVDIKSGDPVLIGATLGVALTDIPDTLSGAVAIQEVFEVRKATGAIAQGAKLYWDADGNHVGGLSLIGALTTTDAGNVYAGRAYAAAGASDGYVKIKLNA